MLIVPQRLEEGNWLIAIRRMDIHPSFENMRSVKVEICG
jgi:hypothetical protein